jgi:hypothetical protein
MTQSAVIGELWTHIRDTQFGATPREAHALLHICKIEFLPATPEHRKRLRKVRLEIIPRGPAIPKAPDPVRLRGNQIDLAARDIVRITRPDFKRNVCAKYPNPPTPEIHIPKRPEPQVRQRDAQTAAKLKRDGLRRDHFIALGKMLNPWQGWSARYSMEVLELFGSFKAYEEACK